MARLWLIRFFIQSSTVIHEIAQVRGTRGLALMEAGAVPNGSPLMLGLHSSLVSFKELSLSATRPTCGPMENLDERSSTSSFPKATKPPRSQSLKEVSRWDSGST